MDTHFRPNHEEEHEHNARHESKAALEFATAEEAIRHDAANTTPPPEIAERLNESLANEPKWGTSFWKKLGFKK